MAGTLTVRIGTPDAKAMRRYRYMWTVTRDGLTLGWGHTNRREEAETDAWDLISDHVAPEDLGAVEVVGA